MVNFEKFRRITTSGDYFPEIDGLRFIAIISVILFHLTSTIRYHTIDKISDYNFITGLYKNGWQGVELFFAISGFIIGMPFAKHYLKGSKKVNLKAYFLRRVTRLEPPYILAIILFFGLQVVTRQNSFTKSLPSLLSSLIYMNNIIFNKIDFLIISVIWSLEIEVQFYVLAIIFSYVFSLSKFKRRFVILIVIFGFPILHRFYFPSTPTIYTFLQFFFIGFLLVDIYLDNKKMILKKLPAIILGLISLFIILYTNYRANLLCEYIYLLSMICFYYIVLTDKFWKTVMSNKFISLTGGMCYTIYLIHSPIISAFSKISVYLKVSNYYLPNLFINSLICIPIVILASSVYFKLIEKPCMDKNWPKKLLNYFISLKHNFIFFKFK